MGSSKNRGSRPRSRKPHAQRQRKDLAAKRELREAQRANRNQKEENGSDVIFICEAASTACHATKDVINLEPDVDPLSATGGSENLDNDPLGRRTSIHPDPLINPWADLFVKGLRSVDLNILAWEMWCRKCDQPLSLRNLVSSKLDMDEVDLRCCGCENIICVHLVEKKKTHDSDPAEISILFQVEELVIIAEDGSEVDANGLDDANVDMACDPDGPVAEEETDFSTIVVAETISEDKLLPLLPETDKIPDKCAFEKEFNAFLLKEREIEEEVCISSIITADERNQLVSGDMYMLPTSDLNNAGPEEIIGSDMENSGSLHHGSMESFEMDLEASRSSSINVEEDDSFEIPSWACEERKCLSFSCGYCCQLFENPTDCFDHRNKSHQEFKQRTCWCGKSFQTMSLLTKHMTKGHDQKALCHECGSTLANSVKLFQHIQVKHAVISKLIKCKKCPKQYKTQTQLLNHLRQIHSEPLICDYCGKSSNTKSRMRQHMVLHTKVFSFSCPICPSKFTRPDNLRNHVKNNHNYACSICAANFTSASAAKNHVKQNHTKAQVLSSGIPSGCQRITKFACNVCGMCLATRQTLQIHSKAKHKNEN